MRLCSYVIDLRNWIHGKEYIPSKLKMRSKVSCKQKLSLNKLHLFYYNLISSKQPEHFVFEILTVSIRYLRTLIQAEIQLGIFIWSLSVYLLPYFKFYRILTKYYCKFIQFMPSDILFFCCGIQRTQTSLLDREK